MVHHLQMRSNGKSVSGYSNSSVKQKLKKCSTSGEDGDLVVIDVDSEIPDVIIVDVPESAKKTLRKASPCTVISIDDDDEVLGEDCSKDNDPSSSNRCPPKPTYSSSPAKVNGSRNRYGLGLESEIGSAESDCSDCECIEGPTEIIREQWELASQRRKVATHSGPSGYIDASTSASLLDDQPKPGVLNAGEQPCLPDQSNSTCVWNVEDTKHEAKSLPFAEHAFGNFLVNNDNHVAQAYLGAETAGKQPYVSDQSGPKCVANGENRKDKEKSFSFAVNALGNPLNYDGKNDHVAQEIPYHGPSSLNTEDPVRAGSSYKENNSSKDAEKPGYIDVELPHDSEEPARATAEQDDILKRPCEDIGAKNSVEPDLCNRQSFFDEHWCFDEREPTEKESAAFRDMMSKYDFKAADKELMASLKTLQERQKAHSDYISRHFVRMEDDGSTSDEPEPTEKEWLAFRDKMSKYDFAAEHEAMMASLKPLQERQKANSDYISRYFVRREADGSTRKPSSDSTFVRTDVVIDRQKLKETDEYKRAMEELQESRQQQIKIQAEEAQRLRRRKRAETMRLMDMEKRQKRRLEEIRETQKKDEQNLNIKEKIRVGIRKELNNLERSCGDMASLLRRLGVNVNGGLAPPKTEVQAAYKRALLTFHPDRAPRTDIRQQVEAEEKFKLISRMKEKLLVAG